ncbi:MAG: hypothetical protein H6601_00470 [Flavobacteriales bacterium]|nr:hypothetical protein [Flavobacteriales bacterium]
MNRRLQVQALIAVLFAGLMFSSCGNIDIVKRKYRPGFHVEVSKKRQKMKTSEESATADARKVENLKAADVREAEVATQEISDELTVSADATTSPFAGVNEVNKNVKKELHSPDFKGLSFDRKMDRIKREVFGPKAPVANLEWMKWVSFGTGIGSLAFGALAFLFAILTVVFWSSFVWGAAVLALLLGAAAITFSLIYKKNNGTGSQSRLGFIFGIIGAGLAVLAIILGAIFFTIFVLG